AVAGLPRPRGRTRAAARCGPARPDRRPAPGAHARRPGAPAARRGRGAHRRARARVPAGSGGRHPQRALVPARPVAARGAGRGARCQGAGLPAGAQLRRARRHRRHPAANHRAPPDPGARCRPRADRAGARDAGRRATALTEPMPASLASQGASGGWHWRAPLRPVRRRVQAWFHNRLRRTDTLTLTQRNVYILPTRAGWMLALTLLVLLVASINFQLNLGYLLTFLLAGSALVGMHVCHNNLRGITLHLHPPEPVHAHQAVVLEARFASERRRPRHGVGLGVVHDDGSPPDLAWTDVPAQGQAQLQVAWRAPGRGLHELPTLMAQTLFPL